MAERALKYPKELVHTYGAKAGLLMHVAKHLSDIPQMPMVVMEQGEPTDIFLRRVSQSGLSGKLLFRSSAVAELDGYEGDFPTIEQGNFGSDHAIVDEIRYSSQFLKQGNPGLKLPDEINVIAAELSPSRYSGTYIKHPNTESEYLIAVTDMYSDSRNRLRSNYRFIQDDTVKELRGLSQGFILDDITEELEEVIVWHDQIAALPEMDFSWSYQIEFGVDPPMLYQVRPFKPIKKATFQLSSDEDEIPLFTPTVIGITPHEGIDAQVVIFPDIHRVSQEVDIAALNLEVSKAVISKLRDVKRSEDVPNVSVNLFSYAAGFLAHQDVKAMRQADVTALFPLGSNPHELKHGEVVNIVSDGRQIQIKQPQN